MSCKDDGAQRMTKLTRVEVIGDTGREYVSYAGAGRYFEVSWQDDNRTLKLFLSPAPLLTMERKT